MIYVLAMCYLTGTLAGQCYHSGVQASLAACRVNGEAANRNIAEWHGLADQRFRCLSLPVPSWRIVE